MKLPKIDVTALPDLEQVTAMFGAMRSPGDAGQGVVIMTVIFENGGGSGGLI